jgi:acyl carrier protein
MDRSGVLAKVIEIFSDVMEVDPEQASADTTAEDVESWDSVSHIRLIISVESAFGTTFTSAEIGSIQRLGDVADTLTIKMGQ